MPGSHILGYRQTRACAPAGYCHFVKKAEHISQKFLVKDIGYHGAGDIRIDVGGQIVHDTLLGGRLWTCLLLEGVTACPKVIVMVTLLLGVEAQGKGEKGQLLMIDAMRQVNGGIVWMIAF